MYKTVLRPSENTPPTSSSLVTCLGNVYPFLWLSKRRKDRKVYWQPCLMAFKTIYYKIFMDKNGVGEVYEFNGKGNGWITWWMMPLTILPFHVVVLVCWLSVTKQVWLWVAPQCTTADCFVFPRYSNLSKNVHSRRPQLNTPCRVQRMWGTFTSATLLQSMLGNGICSWAQQVNIPPAKQLLRTW